MIRVHFSHLDYNVADLELALSFYEPLMAFLGFKMEGREPTWALFGNGRMKLCLVQCEERYKDAGFHRKQPGLNHIAFQAESVAAVDRMADFLNEREIPLLYDSPGSFDPQREYYAVFFEDPFRLKLEVVYSPEYLSSLHEH